jgi:hypothetical protein
MVGDRQRITVLVIAEQELPFVIGAPQLIGALAGPNAFEIIEIQE